MKPKSIIHELYQPQYWEGRGNVLIRYWTYIQRGLDQANGFKYVVGTIFGVYLTLKLGNPLWMVGMFVVSLPTLAILGRWWLHKGAKTSEWVGTHFGTVLGYRSYDNQVEQIELLKKILKSLNGK